MTARRAGAIALAVGLPLIASVVLAGVRQVDSPALAVHVTAVPPFGLAHDLRWLAAGAETWAELTLWLPLAVTARAALDTTIARGLWPGTPPAWTTLFRRALAGTVVTALLLWPWVGLLHAGRALSWSWLVIGGLIPILLLAPWLVTATVVARWWRRPVGWRDLGVATAGAISLTGFGLIAALGPDGAAVVAATASGVVSAALWSQLGRVGDAPAAIPATTGARLRSSWRWSSFGLAATVGLLIAGAAVGFDLGAGGRGVHPDDLSDAAFAGPVLVLGGFETEWDGRVQRWFGSPWSRRFSYAGVEASGDPLPYGPEATEASLETLVGRVDRQVRRLADASGRPVAVVGESLGALVARAYVAAYPEAPVDTVVLISPLLAPGRLVSRAPQQQDPGTPAGAALAALSPLVRAVGPFAVRADSPLLRSIDELGTDLARLQTCRVPGRRVRLLLPAAAGLAQPPLSAIDVPYDVVGGFHGNQLVKRPIQARIAELLSGDDGERTDWRSVYRLANAVSAGWQVPAPALESGDASCDEARTVVRLALRQH